MVENWRPANVESLDVDCLEELANEVSVDSSFHDLHVFRASGLSSLLGDPQVELEHVELVLGF